LSINISIFLLFVFTVFLGYLGNLFYVKTKIPDVIWLLLFGFIIGPVFKLYDPEPFIRASPFMSIIALCIILFDAGINMDLDTFIKVFSRSLLLAFMYYFVNMIFVAALLYSVLSGSISFLNCLLLGAMLNTSPVTLSSLFHSLKRLNFDFKDVENTLLLESVLSTSLSFICVITLIRLIMSPELPLVDSFRNIFLSFIFSMGFGSLSGCFWSFVLNKIRGQKFNYILTIAMVFLIYVVSEGVVESSGALTLLFFGLLLVNSDSIFRKLGFREMFEIEISHLREFHEEITFLLKSFFFVYVGLITNISLNYLFIGLGASLMVLCSRLLVVRLYGYMVKLSVVESDIIKFSIANGLSTLVASRLPLIYDPKGLFVGDPGLYNNVCFVVVIVSVLISMFITPYVASRDIKLISKNVNSNM